MASDLRFEFNETLQQARERNIRDALLEDVGRGDWTGRLLPASHRIHAQLRVREAAVLCGRDWFDGVARAVDAGTVVQWRYDEGADMPAEAIGDHRLAYLDYEGPLSGNRGSVTCWDRGYYEREGDSGERLVLKLAGARLMGVVILQPDGERNW